MNEQNHIHFLESQLRLLRESLVSTNQILDLYIKVVDRLSNENREKDLQIISLQTETAKLLNDKKDLQIQIALLYEILIQEHQKL